MVIKMFGCEELLLPLAEAHVSAGVTALFALLLVGLILCLAFEEKLHAKKSVIAGAFAVICLFLGGAIGVLPFEDVVVGSHALTEHPAIEGTYTDEHDEEHPIEIDAAKEDAAPAAHANEEDTDHAETTHAEPVHVGGHRIRMPVYIPAVDWGVIAIILALALR